MIVFVCMRDIYRIGCMVYLWWMIIIILILREVSCREILSDLGQIHHLRLPSRNLIRCVRLFFCFRFGGVFVLGLGFGLFCVEGLDT